MTLRPSSLPMLAKCARWESSGGNDATSAGTQRHEALSRALDPLGAWVAPDGMSDDDVAAVEWAADYIRTHAPMADHPLHTERGMTLLDAEFAELMRGTPDVACGNHLFDLKWRERDYSAQMAAYALMLMEESEWDEVHVHVLYGERRKAERFTLDRDGAEQLVFRIVEAARNPASVPTPCDYCGWCARRLTCPALTRTAKTVADGYSILDKVHNWHPSEQTDAEQLSTMLYIWRIVLKKWGESVEHHALEAALKQGLTLPGFELKTKAGKSWVTDVPGAFAASGVAQAEFLRACDVRLNTSKTYPDKVGLTELYAAQTGLKKAPAKRDLLKKLEPVMQTGKPTQYLKATDETEESE